MDKSWEINELPPVEEELTHLRALGSIKRARAANARVRGQEQLAQQIEATLAVIEADIANLNNEEQGDG